MAEIIDADTGNPEDYNVVTGKCDRNKISVRAVTKTMVTAKLVNETYREDVVTVEMPRRTAYMVMKMMGAVASGGGYVSEDSNNLYHAIYHALSITNAEMDQRGWRFELRNLIVPQYT